MGFYLKLLHRINWLIVLWIIETDGKGRFPETDEALKAVIDRWGNKAVNKEYDRVRNK